MNRVMIDLETLGTEPGCPIVSLGAVFFNDIQIIGEYEWVITSSSCYRLGLDLVSPATEDWWDEQEPSVKKVLDMHLNDEGDSLRWVLEKFSILCTKANIQEVWGNGSDFDNKILAYAYKTAGMAAPWKFWQNRCFRTLKALFPEIPYALPATPHDALCDAYAQAIHTIKCLEKINHG